MDLICNYITASILSMGSDPEHVTKSGSSLKSPSESFYHLIHQLPLDLLLIVRYFYDLG